LAENLVAADTCRGPTRDRPDGSGQIRSSAAGANSTKFGWAPNSAKLAFLEGLDIVVASPDGSGFQRLTSFPNFATSAPTWSPNSTKVAFSNINFMLSLRDQVYLVNIDGTGLTNVSNANAYYHAEPDWSPDGSRIALIRVVVGQGLQVLLMNPDGSNQINLANLGNGTASGLVWSPNNRELALTKAGSTPQPRDLYTVNAISGELRRLTTGMQVESRPAWSPDGSKLAFSSNGDVYTINADGTGLNNFTQNAAAGNASPVFLMGSSSPTPPPSQMQVYFIHSDHLNTPRVISNQASQVVWRWDHAEPFGSNPPNENPSGLGTFTCNLRLPGQYFDRETNTHYNYFRDYDPGIARYIQFDPIGLRGGINGYAYVGSNPLRFTDPLGLMGYGGGGSAGRGTSSGIPAKSRPLSPRAACIKICDDFQSKCEFAAWTGGITAEMLLCEGACTLASGGTASAPCLMACAALGGLGEAALLAQCSKAGDECRKPCDCK